MPAFGAVEKVGKNTLSNPPVEKGIRGIDSLQHNGRMEAPTQFHLGEGGQGD